MTSLPDRDLYRRGVLLTTSGVLLLTPDALLVRLISCDPWTLLFWRGIFQFTAIALFYVFAKGKAAMRIWKSIGKVGLLISCTYATGNMLFVHSIRTTSVANTLLIISTAPFMAALLSWLLLKEKTPARTWIASATAISGVALIVAGGVSTGSTPGDLLAMLTAITMACSFVLIRRARNVAMIPAVALSGLIMSLFVTPLAAPLSIETRDAGYLFLLGFIIMPLAFGMITLGPRYLPAPEVSLIMLIETVLGPFWVWLAFSEHPPQTTFLGGAIVFATLIMHYRRTIRRAGGT